MKNFWNIHVGRPIISENIWTKIIIFLQIHNFSMYFGEAVGWGKLFDPILFQRYLMMFYEKFENQISKVFRLFLSENILYFTVFLSVVEKNMRWPFLSEIWSATFVHLLIQLFFVPHLRTKLLMRSAFGRRKYENWA